MAKKQYTTDEALVRLQAQCSAAEICVSEANTKLYKWGITADDAKGIISKLIEDRYIDECRYARAFVADKIRFAKWGKTKIKYALAAKRIPANCIEQAFEDYDTEAEQETLKNILNKKYGTFKADVSPNDAFAKLIRFGLSRGYDYDIVKTAATNIIKKRDE